MLRGGFRPCLVLLDLSMPDMNGLAFRREQMADPSLAELRVVVLSADGWRQEAEARSLGIDDFIHKPAPFDRLVSLFDDCRVRSN